MGDNDDGLPKLYEELKGLLSQLGKEADLDKRVSLIEQQYKKESEITKMIEEEIEKNGKNRINWTAILQSVIIAVLSALAVARVMQGA